MNFVLKGEPISTQSLYGLTCRGKFPTRYMTPKGKSLKEDYQWQIRSKWRGKKPLKGEVGIEVKLFFGRKGTHDIDNFSKILLDAFTGIVWKDDCQIQCMLIEKDYCKENPRVELEVYEILK